jgi:predicted nucleic acid-binding protein
VIVVDASTVLELLLGTPAAASIEKRILSPRQTVHAPHLLDLEVAQVLRRYCAGRELEPERAQQALTDLIDLPITRYRHDIFLFRIWELRQNATAYDAAYIALAEALSAPLITRDARLAATPGHRARVELV